MPCQKLYRANSTFSTINTLSNLFDFKVNGKRKVGAVSWWKANCYCNGNYLRNCWNVWNSRSFFTFTLPTHSYLRLKFMIVFCNNGGLMASDIVYCWSISVDKWQPMLYIASILELGGYCMCVLQTRWLLTEWNKKRARVSFQCSGFPKHLVLPAVHVGRYTEYLLSPLCHRLCQIARQKQILSHEF